MIATFKNSAQGSVICPNFADICTFITVMTDLPENGSFLIFFLIRGKTCRWRCIMINVMCFNC